MPLMQFLCVSTGSCSPAYFRYGIAAIIPPGRDGLLMIWGVTPTHKRLPLSGFLKKELYSPFRAHTFSFASAGGYKKILILMLLSATYPADRTKMSNRICSHLLYLRSAAVPGGTFSKCPAERKAVNRYQPF